MYEPGHSYYERLQRSGNVLIVKGDVGKAKPCTVPLPPAAFTFGQSQARDKESVGDIISSWETHHASKPPLPPRDFMTLNVLGVRNGLCTAKALGQFRTRTEALVKMREGRAFSPDRIPDLTFGMKVRPSTPMVEVLGNSYGRSAYDRRDKLYSLSQSFTKLPEPKPAPSLNASFSKAKADKLKQSTFKMRRFLHTAPRTDTNLGKPKSLTSLDLSRLPPPNV